MTERARRALCAELDRKIDRAFADVAAGRVYTGAEVRAQLRRRRKLREALLMRDDRFEWDDRKAASNLRKHTIGFETARAVFDAERFLDRMDDDPDEDRSIRIAEVQGRLLTVVYTERGQRIRIISARKATSQEQQDYAHQS